MYCFEFLTMLDCRTRFRVCARFVPRCGVARNVIAEIALTMDSYSGSFWPCTYALVTQTVSKARDVRVAMHTSFTIRPPML